MRNGTEQHAKHPIKSLGIPLHAHNRARGKEVPLNVGSARSKLSPLGSASTDWSYNIDDAVMVFEYPNMTGQNVVSYNRILRRYARCRLLQHFGT